MMGVLFGPSIAICPHPAWASSSDSLPGCWNYARGVFTLVKPDIMRVVLWRMSALTMEMIFIVVESEDDFFAAGLNYRIDIAVQYTALSRTPTQMIFEVTAFRARKQYEIGDKVLTHEMCLQIFNAKVKLAPGMEEVNVEYMKAC